MTSNDAAEMVQNADKLEWFISKVHPV